MAALYLGCTQDFDQFEPGLGFGGAGMTTSTATGTGGMNIPCTSDDACDDASSCTTDACNLVTNTCAFTPLPDGPAPGITDIPGDCVDQRCVGGVSSIEPDDTEAPDDGSDCTNDSCQNGTAINAPLPEGTPCAAGECNAVGQCTGCNAPEECVGQDTSCSQRTCINSICGVDNQPPGTPLPVGDQTAGDCILRICDGLGGETLTGDNTDPPADDGLDCTAEVCVNDQPTHDPLPQGTPCGSGVCDGAGTCFECVDDGDCTAPETCGGGGVMNQCGCTPLDCAGVGATCGAVPNGCGGTLNCNDGVTNGTETAVDCGGPAGGTCNVDCADGNTCGDSGDCVSGFCTDGVCCNSACGTVCRSCAVPGSVGTCAIVPLLQDDAPLCTGTMTCNGNANNACRLDNGEPCTQANQCASGNCNSNICQ
jgi:hypothetical protein